MIVDQIASRHIEQAESGSTNGLSRRTLLQAGVAVGGGLMLSLTLPFGNGEAQAADTDGFTPTWRLIRDAFAVRERLGDPRAVPSFHCAFFPGMPSPATPGSPIIDRSSSDVGVAFAANRPARHSQYSRNPFPRGVVTFGAT